MIYAEFAPAIQIRARKVTIAGDWAFEWGLLTAIIRPHAGGSPVPIDGKYVLVYARQKDGTWRIAQDIYNGNAPAAGAR